MSDDDDVNDESFSSPTATRVRRRRRKRRARTFYVYRIDPWTKERVKVNENGEEIESDSASSEEEEEEEESDFEASSRVLDASTSASEEEEEEDENGSDDCEEEEEEEEEQNNTTTTALDEDDIALLAVHPTTTTTTTTIEDPRNYCLFRFRWCWKYDSLSWWVAICFLLAALFCVVGSACSCFRRVTRNPKMYVRVELVPYLIGGLFFVFASALTLWASYRAKRRYSKAKKTRRTKFESANSRLREQIRNENDLNEVLFEQRTSEMEPSRQMWLRENNDEWIKRTRKLELIGALLTLIGSGLFVTEIIATMVIADSAHWVTVPVDNGNITHHGHWWYHTHFDSSQDRKQFLQMSTVVEVRTGHYGALAYLFGSWFYWCASKREWVWNPFRLPNGAHEKISFYSLLGSWLFLIGAIMTPPASSFAIANETANRAHSSSTVTHNETTSLGTMILQRLYDEMVNDNTTNSAANVPYSNEYQTHEGITDHARFVKGALWLFVGYVMGSVCYCVQALLMVHTIALADQRKHANSSSSHSHRLRAHLRRSHSHRRNTAV